MSVISEDSGEQNGAPSPGELSIHPDDSETLPATCRTPSKKHVALPEKDLEKFLPATWRTSSRKHIALPEKDLENFLASDLRVTELNKFHNHLWMVGRMLPPRPLHVQRLMSRDIVVTEQVNLHLVWTKGKIFIKPLPRYLLDEGFSQAYIDGNPELAKCARGFLYTYTALVANESDFRIACNSGLLPPAITWSGWQKVVREFLGKHSDPGQKIYGFINERYLYGELRLSRLNAISRWLGVGGSFLYGYSRETSFNLYSDFLGANFNKLAASLVYVVIVLTAMQVGLADGERLGDNQAFRRACYGFTVFSIVAPLAITAGIIAAFVVVFFTHWFRTKRDEIRRYEEMELPRRQ